MLHVEQVTSGYGKVQVLRDVSLHVGRGELVGVVGPSGAGKSTLAKTISGLLRAYSGRIVFGDVDVTRSASDSRIRLGLVHIPERRELFWDLTVEENLRLGAYLRLRGAAKQEVERDLEEAYGLFPILRERRKQVAGTLSGGEQQMLAIARGLMAAPVLALIDEPSLGLAPLIVREIYERFCLLRERGLGLLLLEENVSHVLSVADRVYVLVGGRLVYEGDPKAVNREEIAKLYIG